MNADTPAAAEPLHIACPGCHTLVRVPPGRLSEHPTCSRCKSQILGAAPVALDAQSFQTHIRADLPVIVDFWAPWCGPCQMMAPVLEQAAQQFATKVQLAKINTDEEQALAARFGIRSIPTLILFHRGRELARHSGAVDGARLARWIESALPHQA
jgi:thioredoxin 2